jgi:hypothetical protein
LALLWLLDKESEMKPAPRTWMTVGGVVAILVAVAAGAVVILADSACDYELLNSARSPNGLYIADVTAEDCGRGFGHNYLISIRRTGVEPTNGAPREVLVATFRDEYELTPVWEDLDLTIRWIRIRPRILRSHWRTATISERHEPIDR